MYDVCELKLDISEIKSQIKVLQTAIQNEYSEISKQDIDNTLEILKNKIESVLLNINYFDK